MRDFLDRDGGAVAVSYGATTVVLVAAIAIECHLPTFLVAACYTHLVQISAPGIKRFTPVFIDAVKALNKVKVFWKKILLFYTV